MFDSDRYDVVDPSDYEYWDHHEQPEDGRLPEFGDNLYINDGNSSAPQGIQDDDEDPEDKSRKARRESKVAFQKLDQVMSTIPGTGLGHWLGDAETNGQDASGIGQGSAETNGQDASGIGQGSAETNGQEIPGIGQGNAETNGQETGKEDAHFSDGLDEALDEAMKHYEEAEKAKEAEMTRLKSDNDFLTRSVHDLETSGGQWVEYANGLQEQLETLKKERLAQDETGYVEQLKQDLLDAKFENKSIPDVRERCYIAEAAAKKAKADLEKAKVDAEAHCKDMEAKMKDQLEADRETLAKQIQQEALDYKNQVIAEAKTEVKELKDSQAAQADFYEAQAKEVVELRQQIANAEGYYSETEEKVAILKLMLEHQKSYRNTTEAELQELRRMRDEKVQADKAQADNIQELEQKLENESKDRTTTQTELEQLRCLRDKRVEDDKAQAVEIQKLEQKLNTDAMDRKTAEAELEKLRILLDKRVEDDKAQAAETQKLEQKLKTDATDRKTAEAELQQLRNFRDKQVDADTAQSKNTQKLEQQIENLKEQLSVEQAKAANAEKLSSGADHSAAGDDSHGQAMEELKRDHKESLSKLQKTCEESKAELEDMTKLKEVNDTSVKNHTERIMNLERTVVEKDKAIQKLRNDTSTKTREQMGKDIEELRAELAIVRESEKNQLSLNQQITRDNAKKEKYIEGTDRALKGAKDNLATEKKHHKETIDNLKKTEVRMQAKDKELVEVNVKVETTEKNLKDVSGQLKALNAEVKSIEDVKREIAAVTKEKNITENELLLLEKGFEITKAEYIKLNDEFDMLKKKKKAMEHEVKTQQEVGGGGTKPALEKTLEALAVPKDNLQASEHTEPYSIPTKTLQPLRRQDPVLTRTCSSDLASELVSTAGDESDSSGDEQIQGNPAEKLQAVGSGTVGGLVGPNSAPEAAPKLGNTDGESSKVEAVLKMGNKDGESPKDGAAAKPPDVVKKPQAVGSGTVSGLIGPNSNPEAAPKMGNKDGQSSKFEAAPKIGTKDGQSSKVKAASRIGNKYSQFPKVSAAAKSPDIAKKPRAVGSGTLGGLIGPNSTPEAAPKMGNKDGDSPKVGGAAKPPNIVKKPQGIGSGTVGGSAIPSSIPTAASKTDKKNGGLAQAPTSQSSHSGTCAEKPSSFTSFLPSSSSGYSIPAKWAFLIFLIWILTMLWASTSIADARKERNMWLAANDITMRAVISHRHGVSFGRGIPGYAPGLEMIGRFWHESMDGVQARRTFG